MPKPFHSAVDKAYTQDRLKEVAKTLGLKQGGSKADLIECILAYINANAAAVTSEHPELAIFLTSGSKNASNIKTSAEKDAEDAIAAAQAASQPTGWVIPL